MTTELTKPEAPPEHKYKSAYWLDYPVVYVDSYGWAWGLTSDCQTVCAGRVEKLPEREGSVATGIPPRASESLLRGHRSSPRARFHTRRRND